MNYKSILGFLLLLSITGLLFYLNSNRHYTDPLFTKEFEEGLKKFDSKYVNHFPIEFEQNNSTFLVSENISISHPHIWLKTESKKDDLDTLINYLNTKSIAKYSAEDSCLLIIERHLTEDNQFTYDKSLRVGPTLEFVNKDCYKDKFPVPKFWQTMFFETNDTEIGINKSYQLYILDSKKGLFRNEDSLPNGKYTPTDWQHGYTKGVAIDKESKKVIFWFDIW